jgi:rifampin ADP-ribosylating transferase
MDCVNDVVLAGTTATREPRRFVTNEEMTPMGEPTSTRQPSTHQPVTYDRCAYVEGPFYHGTICARGRRRARPRLQLPAEQGVQQHLLHRAGGDSRPGSGAGREWGAGAHLRRRGHGPFEDDPNVTNKRFPVSPTQSYRTRHPLRVVAELESWQGHAPEVP